ncbi:hypothetical protein [Desulfoluna sp.]|uniref:hypothetical protein n=1 Tax=Desulfoluna sp. TaxID=2045199 RepID=UPI0026096632|nr:hypothetical protein [Desulfoluna sp.]
MEQKYIIDKDLDAGTLTLKEMAETDVGKYSVLHNACFELEAIEAALSAGNEALIALFRNNNFFPPEFPAGVLAEGLRSMFGDDPKNSLKIIFSDNDSLASHREEAQEALATDEKEQVEIDKLLDDDDTEADDAGDSKTAAPDAKA